ncbi:hypothetical protein GIB67_026379 [Kingdonia uniflora]|uniref:Uncharacterized protein n=1 Tax=Kingdonia uniflora TaxID=39325 RepID=A0A7J7P642_9MAGN|nr:hypothetical protein GIB67_026379 [Kingdonia uniflora]
MFRCDLRIVSDANVFFIETILEHHGLMRYFSEINTNLSVIDKEVRLRILPYHDLEMSPRCSNPCPPNMCKGVIIERIRDLFLPRGEKMHLCWGWEGRLLPEFEIIRRWNNGQELENFLLHLIKTIIAEETKNINLSQENQAEVEKNGILRGSLENKVVSLWKGNVVHKYITSGASCDDLMPYRQTLHLSSGKAGGEWSGRYSFPSFSARDVLYSKFSFGLGEPKCIWAPKYGQS